MSVELRHLRALVALSDEESFTDAARVLGVSQATVSRTIGQLEHELGAALVARTTRAVRLTEAGESFLADARRTLAALDHAVRSVRGESHAIRIGYAWAALGARTTPFLRRWNRENPSTPARMLRQNTVDSGLLRGLVDVAVVRHRLEDPELVSARIGEEPRFAAVAADAPLASRTTVALADLATETVGADPLTGTTSPGLWTDAGLPSPRVVVTGDVDGWLDLIGAGDIVGVTAAATVAQYPRPGVVFVPIVDAPAIPVSAVWHRRFRHPLTDRLVRRLVEAYEDHPAHVGGPA